MEMTLDQFAAAAKGWCERKSNEFKYYWPLKGGWEQWVQAELAAYIIDKQNLTEILREQRIYKNNRKKVDWLLNHDHEDNANLIAIELKCQSFENRESFVGGIEDDIIKLRPSNMDADYRGCQTAVMGIYFESTAQAWMKKNGFHEIFSSSEVACAIKRINK